MAYLHESLKGSQISDLHATSIYKQTCSHLSRLYCMSLTTLFCFKIIEQSIAM